jgi:hypothetical protein
MGHKYKYPLLVWLTTVLLGTILYFLFHFLQSTSNPTNGDDLPFYFILALGLSFIFAIPCLALFIISYNRISRLGLKIIPAKFLLFSTSQILCWLSFAIAFSFDQGSILYNLKINMDIILSYSIGLTISFFLYRYRNINLSSQSK